MMPAGKYWLGDLCYVLHAEWDEFCNITIDDTRCVSGEFELKDGRKFASYNTMYGDGCYDGLGVDAGLIGCILVSDIDTDNDSNQISLGRIVEFKEPFVTGSEDGVIRFGNVYIDTGYEPEDEDYDNE